MTMSSDWFYNTAKVVADALDSQGVPYAATHGMEGFPSIPSRDLDLLVAQEDMGAAVQALRHGFEKAGWQFQARKRLSGHFWCFARESAESRVFEVDLVARLRWGPAIFTSRPDPLYRIGGVAIDPWASFVKRFLLAFLSGNHSKAKKASQEYQIPEEHHPVIQDRLAEFLGPDASLELWSNFVSGELSQGSSKNAKAFLWKRFLGCPLTWLCVCKDFFLNRLSLTPLERRMAPIIAFVGPDGVGKSTLVASFADSVAKEIPYTSVVTRHWRPGFLPALVRFKGGKPPVAGQANPPRQKAGRLSGIRLFYYACDYILGHVFCDRPLSAFNRLIIYDRCYIDMIVDPVRFGISPSALIRKVYCHLPKPDLIIAVHDTPERIYDRKPELSPSKIQEVLDELKSLHEEGLIHVCLRADKGLETAVSEMNAILLPLLKDKLFVDPFPKL